MNKFVLFLMLTSHAAGAGAIDWISLRRHVESRITTVDRTQQLESILEAVDKEGYQERPKEPAQEAAMRDVLTIAGEAVRLATVPGLASLDAKWPQRADSNDSLSLPFIPHPGRTLEKAIRFVDNIDPRIGVPFYEFSFRVAQLEFFSTYKLQRTAGNLEQARNYFRTADPPLHSHVASCYLLSAYRRYYEVSSRRTDRTLSLLELALESFELSAFDPNRPNGKVFDNRHEVEGVIRKIRSLIRDDPDREHSYELYGRYSFSFSEGHDEITAHVYGRSYDRMVDALVELGRSTSAVAAIDRLIAVTRRERERLRDVGEDYRQGVMSIFSLREDVDAWMAGFYVRKGNILVGAGREEESLVAYDDAESLVRNEASSVERVNVRIGRGVALTQLKKFAEAEKSFLDAERLTKTTLRERIGTSDLDTPTYFWLFRLQMMQENWAQAIHYLARIEGIPGYPRLVRLSEESQRQLEQGIADLKQKVGFGFSCRKAASKIHHSLAAHLRKWKWWFSRTNAQQ